jgi:hypothetical protein
MNKTIITTLVTSVILLGTSLYTTTSVAGEATKAPTCKEQAKAKGLKDKKEIKAFVKECKAHAKKAKSGK